MCNGDMCGSLCVGEEKCDALDVRGMWVWKRKERGRILEPWRYWVYMVKVKDVLWCIWILKCEFETWAQSNHSNPGVYGN